MSETLTAVSLPTLFGTGTLTVSYSQTEDKERWVHVCGIGLGNRVYHIARSDKVKAGSVSVSVPAANIPDLNKVDAFITYVDDTNTKVTDWDTLVRKVNNRITKPGQTLLMNARPVSATELSTLQAVSETLDQNMTERRKRVGRSLTETEIADSVTQSLQSQNFPVDTLSDEQRQLINMGLMMVEQQESDDETRGNRPPRSAVGCFFCKAGLWLAFVAAGIGVALLLAVATVAALNALAVAPVLVESVAALLNGWFGLQVARLTVAQMLGRVIGLGVGAAAAGGTLGGVGSMLDELIKSSCKEWGAC